MPGTTIYSVARGESREGLVQADAKDKDVIPNDGPLIRATMEIDSWLLQLLRRSIKGPGRSRAH